MTSLAQAAVRVLTTADAQAKADASRLSAQAWRDGALTWDFDAIPPDRPARPSHPVLLAPKDMPKRGKGSITGRLALLHAIAHIELNAIDLAWDMVARFGRRFGRRFADDWVRVGADEARHFCLLQDLMAREDMAYGDLPAHDGLWQAAEATADCVAARLAVVPMVLEARGLDVTPGMIAKFTAVGDTEAANVLNIILQEEVEHVAAGQRWFNYICRENDRVPQEYFQNLVKNYHQGRIKPPFNHDARTQAGLTSDWYEPLSV